MNRSLLQFITKKPKNVEFHKLTEKETKPAEKQKKIGTVYIASMNMRGEWAKKPENTYVLNVTSAQGKTKQERLDFSPMTLIPYKGFACFENYWQAGKVIEGEDKKKHDDWWKKQTEPKRRYPKSKGKRVLHSVFDGKKRDYITSRKEVYIPEYFNMIKDRVSLKKWKEIVESGKDVVVFDFDGPRKEDGSVDIHKVTKEYLLEKVNDPKFPFGHGYIVASQLAGIPIEEYIE